MLGKANSIIKSDEGYKVQSSLGHMEGGADLKLITDPSLLQKLQDIKKHKKITNIIGYNDGSKHTTTLFDFNRIQIFSTFQWKAKNLSIVHWKRRTFLAEIDKNVINIVDPLFNSALYTHDPITYNYNTEEILINLDGILGAGKEVSVILIRNKEITFDID